MPAESPAPVCPPAAAESAPPPPPPPHLLFFYSDTSGSCRRVEGFLAQVLQRRRNHHSFQLRRIDADRHGALAQRLGVDGVPSLVVVENKRVRARLSSPRGCAEISRVLAPWLS
jgi:thioredoxin-like negative regulator of GroEL